MKSGSAPTWDYTWISTLDIPPKVKFFLWKLFHNTLLSRNILSRELSSSWDIYAHSVISMMKLFTIFLVNVLQHNIWQFVQQLSWINIDAQANL